MKTPHFYKARCRLGLINIPYGSDEINLGVEEGPDAVLSEDFLSKFSDSLAHSYSFSKPEDINKSNYQNIIAKEYKELADLISSTIKSGEIQVVVGGDNSVTFSSYVALTQRFNPQDIAYIQFDSHTDIHSFGSSHSGNFHGMYVRAFVDDIESAPVQSLIKKKLPFENIAYIGNIINEDEEKEFISKNSIKIFSRPDILNHKADVLSYIKSLADSKKHVHVVFDIDILDASLAPATGILNPEGMFPEDIFPILEILAKHKSLSLDLVEINPTKPGREKTLEFGRKVIQTLL